MLKDILSRYEELFGEEHHKICTGKNCQCHKEVKDFITQEITKALERVAIKKLFEEEEEEKNKLLIGYNRAVEEIEKNIKNYLE